MPLRALMLDVDGVLVTSPNGKLWNWNAHADLGLDPQLFQTRFFKTHWEDIVLGRADLHERLSPVLAEIAPHLTSRQVADYWFARDAHLDVALLADLAALRGNGVEQHLATVQEHHRARYLWETVGLSERFDAMHYAADLGCAKPDPAFFAKIETRTGFSGDELLLIDDKMANVDGARQAGWRAAFWDGSRRLGEVLAQAA